MKQETISQDESWVNEHAPKLYAAIQDVLGELEVHAIVSYRCCEEAIIHHGRDIDRLYVTHHKYVHPTKHCSYLSFWIRKLKPVSKAYPTRIIKEFKEEDLPIFEEITNINEEVALHLAFRSLYRYIEENQIKFPSTDVGVRALSVYNDVLSEYLLSPDENEMSVGNRFSMLVYDMRFRTFGPHHLTHVLTHILREVLART